MMSPNLGILDDLPTVELAHTPTRIEEMRNLSDRIGVIKKTSLQQWNSRRAKVIVRHDTDTHAGIIFVTNLRLCFEACAGLNVGSAHREATNCCGGFNTRQILDSLNDLVAKDGVAFPFLPGLARSLHPLSGKRRLP